jgi:hypothetical protein
MPKGENESLLLALSWQVVPCVGSKGGRPSHSIAGSFNGSQRIPRKFLPRTTTACEDAECLPLPKFALSFWGIALPESSLAQQPKQPDGNPQTPKNHDCESLSERPGSDSSRPSISAIKEAESFFANSYRPLTSKTMPPPTSAGSPGIDSPLSAGSKRPSTLSDDLPPPKDRQTEQIAQVFSAPVHSDPPVLLPPQQQHEGRHCRWAKQHDAFYLQRQVHGVAFIVFYFSDYSLLFLQFAGHAGRGGGKPPCIVFQGSPLISKNTTSALASVDSESAGES